MINANGKKNKLPIGIFWLTVFATATLSYAAADHETALFTIQTAHIRIPIPS